jgi:hypothetical protein
MEKRQVNIKINVNKGGGMFCAFLAQRNKVKTCGKNKDRE